LFSSDRIPWNPQQVAMSFLDPIFYDQVKRFASLRRRVGPPSVAYDPVVPAGTAMV